MRLLARGDEIVGLDNLNDYYDVTLKQARLDALAQACRASASCKLDLADRRRDEGAVRAQKSIAWCIWPPRPACATRSQNPHGYVYSNVTGT